MKRHASRARSDDVAGGVSKLAVHQRCRNTAVDVVAESRIGTGDVGGREEQRSALVDRLAEVGVSADFAAGPKTVVEAPLTVF